MKLHAIRSLWIIGLLVTSLPIAKAADYYIDPREMTPPAEPATRHRGKPSPRSTPPPSCPATRSYSKKAAPGLARSGRKAPATAARKSPSAATAPEPNRSSTRRRRNRGHQAQQPGILDHRRLRGHQLGHRQRHALRHPRGSRRRPGQTPHPHPQQHGARYLWHHGHAGVQWHHRLLGRWDFHCRWTDFRPSTFDLRPSTFDLRPSTFDLRPSTFDLRLLHSPFTPVGTSGRARRSRPTGFPLCLWRGNTQGGARYGFSRAARILGALVMGMAG